jgi:hypothetical protein
MDFQNGMMLGVIFFCVTTTWKNARYTVLQIRLFLPLYKSDYAIEYLDSFFSQAIYLLSNLLVRSPSHNSRKKSWFQVLISNLNETRRILPNDIRKLV